MRTKLPFTMLIMLVILAFAVGCAPTPATPTAATSPTTPASTAAPASATAPAQPTKASAQTTGNNSSAPKILKIAISTDIDTFDPHGTRSFAVANVVDFMVDTLLKADAKGNIGPSLAKSWETSSDGLTITFHLQSGVKFSDGTPFDAAAVKYNMDRFLNPKTKSATKNPYNLVKETDVIDPLTVQMKLSKPSEALFMAFSNTNIGMISPASIPLNSDQYFNLIGTNAPVGTGPYELKDYVKGDHVTVVRNPNYWGKPPYYDEVEFFITPTAATRESLLLSGQVDISLDPPLADLASLANNPDVKIDQAVSDRVLFVGLNTTTKYLDNPKVRQALNYAIDKEAIVKNILMGYGKPVDSPMPSDFFGYCAGTPQYTYNPTLAKQMLQEAGVPANWQLRFASPTGRYPEDYQVSQAIAGYLKDVGVDAQLKTTDWGSYMSWLTGHKPADAVTDMYFLGWSGGYPHGSVTMSMFQTGTFFNDGFYSNPKLDALISSADAQPDLKQSADMYCQANQIVWADAPWIFLYQGYYPILQSSKIQGLVVLPSEKFDTSNVTPVQ